MGEALRPPRWFPSVAYEDIPYDGFYIFVGLFTMPTIARWFRLLLAIQLC